MELRHWLSESNTSIKGFARAVKVERAMIYRYFLGTIPRARTIRRIEIATGGAVTAQDFYASAVHRMSQPPSPSIGHAPMPHPLPEPMLGAFASMRAMPAELAA